MFCEINEGKIPRKKRMSNYSSTKALSYVVIGCFAVLIICFALYVVISIAEMAVSLPRIDLEDGTTASLGLVAIGLVSIIEILVRLIIIVLFLVWLYKAFKNLPALGANSLEFSPGWAVGWWFVPIANLFKPYQVVSELWRESDADFDANTFLSNQVSAPSIIGWWWGLFIGGNIAGRISNAMIEADSALFPIALILAGLLHGISAYLIIQIIKTITSQQELRSQKVASLNKFIEPPAPPEFH
jgi:Domain of unknown function (DUF4328)